MSYAIHTDIGAIEIGEAYVHMAAVLDSVAEIVHKNNSTWWHDPVTGEHQGRNVGEMLMLAVSELAEALEGHRKNAMDDHLLHRKGIEVELADALIRILDMGKGLGLDVAGAFAEKCAYNLARPDHKPENRVLPGGKAY